MRNLKPNVMVSTGNKCISTQVTYYKVNNILVSRKLSGLFSFLLFVINKEQYFHLIFLIR